MFASRVEVALLRKLVGGGGITGRVGFVPPRKKEMAEVVSTNDIPSKISWPWLVKEPTYHDGGVEYIVAGVAGDRCLLFLYYSE